MFRICKNGLRLNNYLVLVINKSKLCIMEDNEAFNSMFCGGKIDIVIQE